MGQLSTISILLWIFVIVYGFDLFKKSERVIQMRKLKDCSGTSNWTISARNFKMTYRKETKEHIMNVNLVVKDEISTDFAMSISFLKCDSSGNPDTCEFLIKDQMVENICKYLVMKDQSWSEFLSYFDKPIVCPIKPGNYHVQNLIVNSGALNKLPVKDALWKLNFSGYQKRKRLSCVDIEINVLTLKGGRRS